MTGPSERAASQSQAPYTTPSQTIDVAIEVTAQGGGKPVIVGQTNLPDGFQAIAAMHDGQSVLGQANIVVRSGRFTAGPFSMEGAAYPRGAYVFTLDSPFTELQPPNVQAAIGPGGAFLRGPSVTLYEGQRLVAFQAPIEIR